jgi:hypothetical protein
MEVTRVKVLARSIFLMVVGAGGVSWAAGSGKSPLEELPPYIRQVTHFGERADWSHDGRRLLFLEKTLGDVSEVELATGIIRPMTQHVDLYKLALDGTGRTERITYFCDYPGYKASNPVVSDDGRYSAFQFARAGDPAGVGRGLLVLDLAARAKAQTTHDR